MTLVADLGGSEIVVAVVWYRLEVASAAAVECGKRKDPVPAAAAKETVLLTPWESIIVLKTVG
jgi:hypothetical protein